MSSWMIICLGCYMVYDKGLNNILTPMSMGASQSKQSPTQRLLQQPYLKAIFEKDSSQILHLSAPWAKKIETCHQSLFQEITARQLIVSALEVKTTVGHTLALSTCIEMTRASLSQPRPQVYSPPLEISLQTCFWGPSNGGQRFGWQNSPNCVLTNFTLSLFQHYRSNIKGRNF